MKPETNCGNMVKINGKMKAIVRLSTLADNRSMSTHQMRIVVGCNALLVTQGVNREDEKSDVVPSNINVCV